MRLLLRLVILLAAVWSGAWFVTARGAERAAETWFAEAARDGWIAGYDALATGGYPVRVALALEGARLIDPATGSGWEAPALRAVAAVWRPRVVVVALPEPQRVWIGGAPVSVAGVLSAQARPGWLGDAAPALTVAGGPLTLEGEGWQAGLDRLEGAARLEGGTGRLDLALAGIGLDPALVPAGVPARIDRVRLAAEAPLIRDPFGGLMPEAVRLDVAELVWGATRVSAEGGLTLDPESRPEGRITFRARNWQPLLDLAVAAGWVEAEVALTLARVGETLEAAAGAAGELELPMDFRNGRMSLGPIPLGPAPRLLPAGI